MCNFGIPLSKFGCHGNSLCSLKNSDRILQFADIEYPTIHRINFSISCTELKAVQFWLNFFIKFGCHGNTLCSLKNSDSIFEFYILVNLIIYVKNVTISRTELKSVHFLSKCRCYCNYLCSLKIFVSIFEFAEQENPTTHPNSVSISYTKLKNVQFWFSFA